MGTFPQNVTPFPPALPFLLPPSTHQPPYVKNLIIMIFVSQSGKSPLMIALDKGHLDIVKTLIEAGANVNQRDKVSVCVLLLYSVNAHTVLPWSLLCLTKDLISFIFF